MEDYEYHKNEMIDLLIKKLAPLESSSLKKRIPELRRRITELLIKQDHGLWGALILLNRLNPQSTKKEGNVKPYKYSYESALAVALHNDRVYEEIWDLKSEVLTFKDIPFAFLLMFCDSAQEWGRPSIKELLHLKYEDKKEKVVKIGEITVKDNDINISFNSNYKLKTSQPNKYWSTGKDIDGININFFISYCIEKQPCPTQEWKF
jgi:hypothetical protein